MGRTQGRKVASVLDRLEDFYGSPVPTRDFEPVDELVSCILSQHTSDATSFPAFDRLKETYPTWDKVVNAGPQRIADVVRTAGLANQKSKNIVSALKEIKRRNAEYSLENLREMDLTSARKWLESLPGVGPKTASIVLCFSFGMRAIPVDTHVFRVSNRLGLLPDKTNEARAHDQLLEIVPEGDSFRYHMLLIQHGRQVCKARRPLCGQCPVLSLCPYGKQVVKRERVQRS